VGASGYDEGDARRYYGAVIDEINAEGGVAGREVVPVYHAYDATSSIPQGWRNRASSERGPGSRW
jgi:hypothetical protein